MNFGSGSRVAWCLLVCLFACDRSERDESDDDGVTRSSGGRGALDAGLPESSTRCGNAFREGSEACDDGNTNDGDYCSADCTTVSGSCNDAVLQDNEPCDPGLDSRVCTPTCMLRPGFSCTREPFACKEVSLAGLADPTAQVHDLNATDSAALCGWVQREWQAHLPPSGYRACGRTFDDAYKVDLAKDTCDTLLARTSMLNTDFQRVIARCPISVATYERCLLEIIIAPCMHSSLGPGIDPSCLRAGCTLGQEGASCTSPSQCQTQYCCPVGTGDEQTCSARYCTTGKEGAACTGNVYCESKRCLRGVCIPPYGLTAGAACQANEECETQRCTDGVCRGGAAADSKCSLDAECASNLCCKYKTGGSTCAGEKGCMRVLGNHCTTKSDCLDKSCFSLGASGGFCTQECKTDQDCGMNGYGLPNWCFEDASGGSRCYPGCNDVFHCQSFSGCTTTQCRTQNVGCRTFDGRNRVCEPL